MDLAHQQPDGRVRDASSREQDGGFFSGCALEQVCAQLVVFPLTEDDLAFHAACSRKRRRENSTNCGSVRQLPAKLVGPQQKCRYCRPWNGCMPVPPG